MLCESYTTYCRAIPSSLCLLTRLQNNSQLCIFQQTPPVPDGYPNLSEFISKPQQHIEDLLSLFENISSSLCTTPTEGCNGDLAEIIEGLRGCLPMEEDNLNTSNCDLLEYGFVEDESFSADHSFHGELSREEDILNRISFCDGEPSSRVLLGDCNLIQMSNVVFANEWQWDEVNISRFN